MITDTLAKISAAIIVTLSAQLASPIVPQSTLASHEFSLNKRYPVPSVSDVFKDNILLNIAYLDGQVKSASDIQWDELEKPFHAEVKLDPGKVFAFHDDVLSEYKDKITLTSNAHFNAADGFKSDGYLFGDGVCHLASLLYWTAKDAGLDANAPTRHDFMAIPEISKEFGVSIYNNPFTKGTNAQQNLYITNNKSKAITFNFDYNGDKLKVSVVEDN